MYIYLFKILISYNNDDPASETLLCLYVFLLCLKYWGEKTQASGKNPNAKGAQKYHYNDLTQGLGFG